MTEFGSTQSKEAQNPYSRIPDLVKGSFVENPKKTKLPRRNRQELLRIIKEDAYIDPMLMAILEAQKMFLLPSKTKADSKLLEDIFIAGMGSPKEEAKIRINESVSKIIEEIEKNDIQIKEKHLFTANSHPRYDEFMLIMPSFKNIENSEKLEVATIQIRHVSNISGVEQREANDHNMWRVSMDDALGIQPQDGENYFLKNDLLVELLKREPNNPLGEKGKFYSRKYAGISLKDIDQMPYPFSIENLQMVTGFIIEAYSDKSINPIDQDMLTMLFFHPTFFSTVTTKHFEHKNPSLLANINYWREMMALPILFPPADTLDAETDNVAVKQFLMVIPKDEVLSLIMINASNPGESDPYQDEPMQERIDLHPILYHAFVDYGEAQLGLKNTLTTMMYRDEIGVNYLGNTIIPQLEQRLKELGVDEKFKDEIIRLKTYAEENPYSKTHLEIIKQIFEKAVGGEFLEKLATHSEDIQQITKKAWEDTMQQMHFLPMENGENIIEFSKDSIPDILGLSVIRMMRLGSNQDWKIAITYSLNDTNFDLLAALDQKGVLTFRTNLQQEIPGLYDLLNHIAVLTFHDLVIQERKEGEVRGRNFDENGEKGKGERNEEQSNEYRSLPRTQRDSDLIADVYEKGIKPRRVELHKALLRGAKDYQSAVELYNEAIRTNAQTDMIEWIKQELEAIRNKTYRISERKKLNMPSRFQLATIQDPLTNENRHLETWVVEHTSPKPTEEELRSPTKLFERYYRGSSALASLDQMKPWLIGQ